MNRRVDQLARASARIGAPAHLLRYWATRFELAGAAGGDAPLPPSVIDALGGVKLLIEDGDWSTDDVDRLLAAHGVGALRDLAPTELTGLAPEEARADLAARLAGLLRAREALASAEATADDTTAYGAPSKPDHGAASTPSD